MDTLPQAADFRQECEVLAEPLWSMSRDQWGMPTQFKGWTCNDILGHLHMFDHAAALTLRSREELQAFLAEIFAARAAGDTLVTYTRKWLRGSEGPELLDQWLDFSRQLADVVALEEPSRRVAWGGPDMSVRSLVSARQMETWSHGQAVFDLLGRERPEADRLKNVAFMGVNTFGFAFANRGSPVPGSKPLVRLNAPSGAVWEWGSDGQDDQIQGSAVEFCQVVTQTRNVADTRLKVTGPIARQWMSIAQCFAGPPEPPPAPGTRFRQ